MFEELLTFLPLLSLISLTGGSILIGLICFGILQIIMKVLFDKSSYEGIALNTLCFLSVLAILATLPSIYDVSAYVISSQIYMLWSKKRTISFLIRVSSFKPFDDYY